MPINSSNFGFIKKKKTNKTITVWESHEIVNLYPYDYLKYTMNDWHDESLNCSYRRTKCAYRFFFESPGQTIVVTFVFFVFFFFSPFQDYLPYLPEYLYYYTYATSQSVRAKVAFPHVPKRFGKHWNNTSIVAHVHNYPRNSHRSSRTYVMFFSKGVATRALGKSFILSHNIFTYVSILVK